MLSLVGVLLLAAAASARLPGPPNAVLRSHGDRVVLTVNRSYCWEEGSGTLCADRVCDPDDCTPPQGKLRVHSRGRVRIDVGRKAKRVKLGRREARRRGESGRYWRWRVPRFGSERIVELAVWYPRQIENPYTQGPVRLRQHFHASQARAVGPAFTASITDVFAVSRGYCGSGSPSFSQMLSSSLGTTHGVPLRPTQMTSGGGFVTPCLTAPSRQ